MYSFCLKISHFECILDYKSKTQMWKFMVTAYKIGPGVHIVFQAGIPDRFFTGQLRSVS